MSIVNLKAKDAPKSARSAMETLLFTADEVALWRLPAFQRPLRMNEKVRAAAATMKDDGGIIPGVLTLGKIIGEKTHYIVDGQHRVEAFKLSGLSECIADVRIVTFETMGEMAAEFLMLNSRIAAMRPDDFLRGLEESTPALLRIRTACDFVGYGQIRRGNPTSPVVGMSTLLKNWHWSAGDTPAINTTYTASRIAEAMDDLECQRLIVFMQTARAAWGSDQENYRLWGALNLTLTMWLWRQLVLDKDRSIKRSIVLTPDLFKKCLMSVSSDGSYLDWLVGRSMTERDRSPCYIRLKSIFAKRLAQETSKKVVLPSPAWSSR